MTNGRRRHFWIPVESLLAHVPPGVEACDLKNHWRFISVRPRVRKALLVIEWVEECERIEVRRNVQFARALLRSMPTNDPSDWHRPLEFDQRLALRA